MSSAIEQIDDQGMAAWDRHDVDAFIALFAEDFVWTDLTLPEAMRTKDQVRQYMQVWFTAFPDMRVRQTNRVVSQVRSPPRWSSRLAALARAQEQELAEQAPHIIGMTVAEHADQPGDFVQTVYFTAEAGTRRYEREHPVESDPQWAEAFRLMRDLRYFDLREPRLDSPV
jgi:SnoaL-like domain